METHEWVNLDSALKVKHFRTMAHCDWWF